MYGYGGNHIVVVEATTPRSTATLMKTGQTTVYRTGDDADTSANGRAVDFFTLDTAPVHNNGSATINTTTNRFTDTLGGQSFANNIVLDWSTWNGSTLLGYSKNLQGIVGTTWNDSIDGALVFTAGTYVSGWRLWNYNEASNICDFSLSIVCNYAPFNFGASYTIWTSTSRNAGTTSAFFLYPASSLGYHLGFAAKTSSAGFAYLPVRTFSLSTLNVLS